MNCEFFSKKERPHCSLGLYGGSPTAENCDNCFKLKQNNKQFVEILNNIQRQKINGIGDIIHKITSPFAIAIDGTLGTNIQNCGGCKKRREALNKLFPINNPNP